jgi:hypothetical protein
LDPDEQSILPEVVEVMRDLLDVKAQVAHPVVSHQQTAQMAVDL